MDRFKVGDIVSLRAAPAATRGIVVEGDGYFVTVLWWRRPFMERRETMHVDLDLVLADDVA
jgi:hypothetical protein